MPTFEIGGVNVGLVTGVVYLLARLVDFAQRDPATAVKWLRFALGIIGVFAIARSTFLAFVPSIDAPDVGLLFTAALFMAGGTALGLLRIAHNEAS